MFTPPAPLAAMAALRQFILVRIVPRDGGKTDKLPCDWRTGQVFEKGSDWMNRPDCLTDYATAADLVHQRGLHWGVGFLFTASTGFWFLDIDNCRQGSVWSPLAQQLCATFPGACIEVSSSGNGLHIFGRGVVPPHGCKNIALGLEFYHEGRFVLLGSSQVGDCSTDHTEVLQRVLPVYFPHAAGAAAISDELPGAPSEEWCGPTDDDELIRRACASTSRLAAFGTTSTASFADLWHANVDALSRAYPDAGGKGRSYDASSADAALMQHLSFWTGRHGTRMVNLIQRSALRREKWERSDYLVRTALRAVSMGRAVCKDRPTQPPSGPVSAEAPAPEPTEGGGFCGIPEQMNLFKGCVYVSQGHFALIPGSGKPMKPDRFDVHYGGRAFALDATNEKVTKRAWEAFTLNQAFRPPIADELCFRPTKPPGSIIVENGIRMANIWVPVPVERKAGDIGLFLNHLRLLLPNQHDRQVILSYMAAVVQHQGVKFSWAPLLQGVEGNGKSFLTECVESAVGSQYVHTPRADQISKNFNSWLFGKVLIAVEDVFVAHDRVEVFEILKPMITAARQPVEPKGVDQAMVDVVANFLFNSNHVDGLRKTRNDRRIAPLFCAQQQKADLDRDGLTGAYFTQLFTWYRRQGGRAAVNEYLWTYEIPQGYNPATDSMRAPNTSSTEAAVSAGLGVIEQHVLEAIEQGRVGFRDGWVSSTYLGQLLDELHAGAKVPPARRRAMLQTLGYDWHPALHEGRLDNLVLPDMARSKLFVAGGHRTISWTDRGAVARAYSEAQK